MKVCFYTIQYYQCFRAVVRLLAAASNDFHALKSGEVRARTRDNPFYSVRKICIISPGNYAREAECTDKLAEFLLFNYARAREAECFNSGCEICGISTLSCACVVTRRDNTDFTDAIKKGCLACARVPLHFMLFTVRRNYEKLRLVAKKR